MALFSNKYINKYFKNFMVLISTPANIDTYNQCIQTLFEVLNNF